ncbi:MAG: hypothetical protein PGN34_03255 [Methylobacterium frigidaeris]
MGYENVRVPATGADGFIGSHLTDALVRSTALAAATGWRRRTSPHDGLDRTVAWRRARLAAGLVRRQKDDIT